jgi:two-component system, OmpR family, sensor histidine kinase CiaH
MSANQQRKRLRAAILSFWLLLGYIIAALVWWFITLEQQNREIARIKTTPAIVNIPPETGNAVNALEAAKVANLRKRRTFKYAGEGVTFLVIILLGAAFVYRGVKKQLELNQRQQDFIMAVTHELKTPLAIGRLNIETLLKRKLPEEKQQRLLHDTLSEMQRLNDLTTNILVVSRLDAGEYHRNNEALHLSALVMQTVDDFEKQHGEKTITTDIEPDVFTVGDTLLLKLVVSNLLANALKYSGAGKPVLIKLAGKTKPILTVTDNGPGIPDAEKQKIFTKFYRIENEITRNTQGTGLGLYLCKKILTDHKSEIQITDNRPTGSIFTVTFTKQHG